MDSRSRYFGVVVGKPVDFLPRIPILMRYAAEYIGSYYGAFAADYRVLVDANHRCAEGFGMDQVSAISDPFRETHGFGADIVFPRDDVPRCLHPPLEDSKDLALLSKPDPLRDERMLDRVNAVRAFRAESGDRYSILGWVEGPAAEAADLRGAQNFLMDLLLDEPFVVDLMDLCLEVGIDFARAQVEAGADTIGVGDAIASQVSPKTYERLIQPREKTLVDAIHDMGAMVRLHICGDITHLLPGVADLGVEIVDVDSLVDLRRSRDILGHGVVLAGNINPVTGVLRGTPDSIRETMHELYASVGNPYMIAAGCEIPAGTPVENLKALCEPVPYHP